MITQLKKELGTKEGFEKSKKEALEAIWAINPTGATREIKEFKCKRTGVLVTNNCECPKCLLDFERKEEFEREIYENMA